MNLIYRDIIYIALLAISFLVNISNTQEAHSRNYDQQQQIKKIEKAFNIAHDFSVDEMIHYNERYQRELRMKGE